MSTGEAIAYEFADASGRRRAISAGAESCRIFTSFAVAAHVLVDRHSVYPRHRISDRRARPWTATEARWTRALRGVAAPRQIPPRRS